MHSGPLAATIALTLNTRIAPFNSHMARTALNYAVDRNVVLSLNGGSLAAVATCQVLPPTMPGYQPYCPYTLQPGPGGAESAPDLAQAKRLVAASGTQGDKVTVLYSDQGTPYPSLATARYVVSVLDVLGFRAALRPVDPEAYWNVLGDSRNRVQVGFFGWFQDYPAPSDFIDPLFTCGSFLSGNPGNVNTALFCDPKVDVLARQALASQGGNPATAASQ